VTEDRPPKRRDLLVTIAHGATGGGLALALWPFIAALGPPADIRARRVVFNLADLQRATPSLIWVRDRPVMIFRRTPEELALLRNPPQPLNERAQEAKASWHRSKKPEIAVLSAMCTRGDCIVRRPSAEPEFACPCCNARYDLAGRLLSGPALGNLAVPSHDYVADALIEFPEYDAGGVTP